MSVPSDNDQHQIPEPRAWVVRAGRDGERSNTIWITALSASDGAIGVKDSTHLRTEKSLGNTFDRIPDPGAVRGIKFGSSLREIEVGDLVVMPQKRPELGRRRLIAIGRVVGPYEYDPSQPEDTRQRRTVEWLQTDLPRETLQDDLRKVDGRLLPLPIR